MKNNIGALSEPQHFRKDNYWYPRRFKPEYGLDEWLCGTPFLSLAEQIELNGGKLPYEAKRTFKAKLYKFSVRIN